MKRLLLLLVVAALFGCKNAKNNIEQKVLAERDSTRVMDSIETSIVKHKDSILHTWSYSSDTDQMRNIINKFASIHSLDGKFLLLLRNKDKKTDILLSSNDDIFSEIKLLCKFDNENIEKCDGDKSDDATALFLEDFNITAVKGSYENKFDTNKNKFIEEIKTHNKLIIEAELYSKKVQSTFNIKGLKWDSQ